MLQWGKDTVMLLSPTWIRHTLPACNQSSQLLNHLAVKRHG
ncbi:Unknown protein sequence [Pseudomonas syringae pv. aceris]|nr:Unknown protein sequence [Pseudomonas syringae pv. aceris]